MNPGTQHTTKIVGEPDPNRSSVPENETVAQKRQGWGRKQKLGVRSTIYVFLGMRPFISGFLKFDMSN